MNKKVILILLFTLIVPGVLAYCDSNQIDINEASKEELDKLYGIGPAKSEAIIDSRPFDSIEDLIEVYGIGEATLKKIKEQDLACVESESKEDDDESEEKEEVQKEGESKEIAEKMSDKKEFYPQETTEGKDPIEETIKLSPQTIKTEENTESTSTKSYPIIGLILFCLIIGTLYFIKERKYKKSEFK